MTQVPNNWLPIDQAPKDNKRPLFIAEFNAEGVLIELDWDASWEAESESWEIPQVYYIWKSANGRVEEPTHFAYMDTAIGKQQVKPAPAVGTYWEHSSGRQYKVEALANMDSENPKYEPTVVYRGTGNNKIWSRPLHDWYRSMTPMVKP